MAVVGDFVGDSVGAFDGLLVLGAIVVGVSVGGYVGGLRVGAAV